MRLQENSGKIKIKLQFRGQTQQQQQQTVSFRFLYQLYHENMVKKCKEHTQTMLVMYCNPSSVIIDIVAALETRLFVCAVFT